MKLDLTVSSIVCEGCADTIKKAVSTKDPEAEVSVNLDNKKVTIETKASEAEIKQAIVASGHTVD